MSYSPGLGDITDDIAAALGRLRDYASSVQTGGEELAQKIKSAGDFAVQLSNAATGAAAGAKAGYNAPTTPAGQVASLVTPALVFGGLYLFLRRRR